MKIYLRKIDDQCINKQISYPKDILKEFLDGKGDHDTILCEGKTSHLSENVSLLLSTDPRFDSKIKTILNAEGDLQNGDIMIMFKTKSKYIVELLKPNSSKYNSYLELFDDNDRHLLVNLAADSECHDPNYYDECNRNVGGENIIYYGTPGCGKSFFVDKKYKSAEMKIYRTVFHPEYSNTDFVGQLIPQADPMDKSRVTYEFKEGIFTEAFKYAYFHPEEDVVLIIEEINRGNASAIFGEIFQLLDREDSGKSHYYIHNDKIATSLNQTSSYDIYLPSNLHLVATMNTSDQNVFTLDTAFKRRWNMIKIRNTFDEMDADVNKQNKDLDYLRKISSMYIPGSNYTWREFVETINDKLSTKSSSGFSIHSEDKEIGLYFVSKKYLCDKNHDLDMNKRKIFGEKVLMYIWNDVAKTAPNKWFDDKTLDKVLESFERNTIESLQVFNNELFPVKVIPSSTITENQSTND